MSDTARQNETTIEYGPDGEVWGVTGQGYSLSRGNRWVTVVLGGDEFQITIQDGCLRVICVAEREAARLGDAA